MFVFAIHRPHSIMIVTLSFLRMYMATTKPDLILHPLRMRIIMTIAGKQMTAQNLAAALPDIAQATLYRHINKLAQGGVLAVIEERPVRGTMEKVYSLSQNAAFLGVSDIAEMSK